ncbi:hypothetical protein SAMN05421752_13110 [Natronorubrum thiooxidans]|uniref:Uncharacterized protein n=1 Tax=Natronorubrum thiooxidans TaxID=308853 RepID=A0A1N7H8B2_9EURY|nr:hypothetical protein SAMN05421752_13110 [Natronorubrum thiooxidans]
MNTKSECRTSQSAIKAEGRTLSTGQIVNCETYVSHNNEY